MKKLTTITFLLLFTSTIVFNQDTFSIVAVDEETGEVGSAGASCVDLSNFPGFATDFLGELFPGIGAINTQAFYSQINQINARNRMNAGDTPQEIIDWLINNDVNGQPQFRQYGIVALVDGMPESAGHTGTSTDDYKNHVLGPNYAIQGNILLGQEILDSMESRFLNEEGDLSCKLMAALQGANVVGADTRCAPLGTSSLFAFVKVAQPEDTFGNPSFVQSVRFSANQGIEPIDSLQNLFDEVKSCMVSNTDEKDELSNQIRLYPNPTYDKVTIDVEYESAVLTNIMAQQLTTFYNEKVLNLDGYNSGIYYVHLTLKSGQRSTIKVIKQ